MQEFQSIPGLAGRLFGGGAGASDLRRAHHRQQQGPGGGGTRCGGAAAPEAVKCPRCESTNTKFCYYNNYNLSQPRHFCKSCRRYWTKGGVLRNVPVGGGCRKAKRSSSSASLSSSSSSAPSTPSLAGEANKNPRRASASSPRSTNSGSTSPAADTTTTTPSITPPSSNITITDGGGLSAAIPFSTVDVAPPAPIFADHEAALASLFAPPPPPPLPVFSFTAQQQPKDEGSVLLAAGQAAARPDEAAADMAPFTALDAGIFEQLSDPSAAYWNAGSCWTDPTVYLP